MVTTEETKKFKFDWTKAAGYITTAVIIIAMVVLHLCGVVQIKNIDTACKYTQESVKLASISYFTLCKDEFAPEKVQEITNAVLASFKTTTEQIKAGKIDLTDAQKAITTEVDKAIDASKVKNPEMTKKLAHIMIDAGFKSIETYSNDIIKDSQDYVKLLNAISTGIEQGYKVVYPDPAEVKKTEETKSVTTKTPVKNAIKAITTKPATKKTETVKPTNKKPADTKKTTFIFYEKTYMFAA